MKRLCLLLFAISTLSLNVSCWCKPSDTPLVVIIDDASVTPDGILHCQWTIRNMGRKPLYVYTSSLNGMSEGMVEVKRSNLILARTTWLETVPGYPVYYFPPANFAEIKPGDTLSGRLERRVSFPSIKPDTKIQMVIGYGDSVDRVKTQIDLDLKGGSTFQGNAITRWQRLAFSAVTQLQLPSSAGLRQK